MSALTRPKERTQSQEKANTPKPILSVISTTGTPLEVNIPDFEGPLDLLLHLIRKKKFDVYEVRLSELTSSYLEHIEAMQSVNLEIAGEFLDIAATLILIKSRQLLPKPEIQEELEENPEEMLRQRLIEYQKYKSAAFDLSQRDVLFRDVFPHPPHLELQTISEERELEFEELSIVSLMEAFQKVMAQKPDRVQHIVEVESERIEDRMEALIRKFALTLDYRFDELFESIATRSTIILTFMAILEMLKLKLIKVVQLHNFSPIHCRRHDDFEQNLERWYASHLMAESEEKDIDDHES